MKRTLTIAAVAAGLCAAAPVAAKDGHGFWRGHGHGHGHGYGRNETIALTAIGGYENSVGDEGAAEISAYDPDSMRLFVVSNEDDHVELTVLSLADPTSPAYVTSITFDGLSPNSVAVKNGLVAVALEADEKTDNGFLNFYDVDGVEVASCTVGALPDMVAFTPNGRHALVANEGEPNDAYDIDPEGSVSVVNVFLAKRFGCKHAVRDAGFGRFNRKADQLRAKGVRLFGFNNPTVAQDLEPEYIAVSENSRYAWITLQENNAMALLDVRRAKILRVIPFGYKDHSLAGNGLDASDRDDAINIARWPVLGMYQPDAIASFSHRGRTYLVTANEGDAREYETDDESVFVEEERIKDLDLDPTAFPDAEDLQEDEALGRLTVTTTLGDTDGDGDYDALYAFGARSFSVWSAYGGLVFDSGDQIEQITAVETPAYFNANDGDADEFDNRSDAKGPEPEGVVVGEVKGKPYAFIGLERAGGGVMVFDLSSPSAPEYVQYVPGFETGDIAPEGLVFISKKDSPSGQPLLVVSSEVSGTVRIYAIESVLKD